MENIEKCHKYLIQYMLKNGVSTPQEVIEFCSKINNEDMNETKLGLMINQINRVISNQYFRLVNAKCEVTQKDLLMLVNMKNDELTKQQLNFSEKELEYFKAILDEILKSEQRKIMFVVCINITSTLTTTFTRDGGLKVLNKWINGGYFVKNGEYVHIGPRLIVEFTSFLKAYRPECICYLCSELSFTGKICDNCDKMFHSDCLEKYFQTQSNCPNCKESWSETQVFKNIESYLSQDDNDVSEAGPSEKRGKRR